jgi:phage N-6-adenine-methyltransferase
VTITSGLMSSERSDWAKPWELFLSLDAVYRFDLDVCATADNAKCAWFFSPAEDGLAQEWVISKSSLLSLAVPPAGDMDCARTVVAFCNPPYGREIAAWMKKAWKAGGGRGAVVVCLVPARTDTRWWHDYAMKATYISFIPGRIRFEGAPSTAPFPSAVVVFGPGAKPPYPTVVVVS